jgi:hypothetical protein
MSDFVHELNRDLETLCMQMQVSRQCISVLLLQYEVSVMCTQSAAGRLSRICFSGPSRQCCQQKFHNEFFLQIQQCLWSLPEFFFGGGGGGQGGWCRKFTYRLMFKTFKNILNGFWLHKYNFKIV